MLAEERRFQIREVLATERTVAASDLCDRLKVTAATIRRDLAVLEQEGVLVRSHGGAVSRMSSTNFQPSYGALLRSRSEEKRQIARAAECLVLDGDTVFLEGSTTVFELARHLIHRHRLTVVTNSPTIVCELQRSPGVTVLCTGGDLQKDTFYLSGEWAQRALSEIRLDKAILGISAIDPTTGSQPPATPRRKSRRWFRRRPRRESRSPITENSACSASLTLAPSPISTSWSPIREPIRATSKRCETPDSR
jgi:DeoR family transcriptional regulator, fructose operon transcriptional repressor